MLGDMSTFRTTSGRPPQANVFLLLLALFGGGRD
jgi:hypothetical protein